MVEIEWAANGSFEKWSKGMPKLFHRLFPAEVKRAKGYSGFGVQVEGGGIYQYVETMPGMLYRLSVRHKGGKGAVSILAGLSISLATSMSLKRDEDFEEYSFKWKASSSKAWLILSDELDGEPSIFDDLRFTASIVEAEGGYEFVTNGYFEFWRETPIGTVLPADGWRVIGSSKISQAEGLKGLAAEVNAEAPESGLRQFMAIEKDEECILSVSHRGGPAKIILSDNETKRVSKSLYLEESEDWKTLSTEWISTTHSVCLRLVDEPDGKPSYFDYVSLRCKPSGSVTYEPPINVIFILHVEPMTRPGVASSPEQFEDWRQTILWLKERFEEHGHKITALFNGEYMEYVVDLGLEDEIRNLSRDGHQIGTHIHGGYREEPHRWRFQIDRSKWDDSVREWDTTVECVEKVIPHSENDTVCAIVNRKFERKLMMRHGFKIAYNSSGIPPWREWRGRCDMAYLYIGHNPYFPYRPADSEVPGEELMEDLNGPFVEIPYYAQIGDLFGRYHPISGLIDCQRYFLNIFRAWLSKESTPEPEGKDKVWIYGWLTHAGSHWGPMNERIKEDIEKMLWWLDINFIGKKTPRGNLIAKPATVREVYAQFLQWEKKHPKQSSFTYIHPKEAVGEPSLWTRPRRRP